MFFAGFWDDGGDEEEANGLYRNERTGSAPGYDSFLGRWRMHCNGRETAEAGGRKNLKELGMVSLYFPCISRKRCPPQEKKPFLHTFFWRLQKSMAFGETRPAGLDFNGGELLHVAGNVLPSAEWAGINVGRFCWEGMKVREGVGACSFFHRRRQLPRGGLLFVDRVTIHQCGNNDKCENGLL